MIENGNGGGGHLMNGGKNHVQDAMYFGISMKKKSMKMKHKG
jgi:hypothetical protein